jgi:L-lactate utilization protein LutC
MTSLRDTFLQRVRQAVAEGNRAGTAADIPNRGNVGYQGSGPDPVARFCEELTALGGHPHVLQDREAAIAKVLELVKSQSVKQALVGRGTLIDTLGLPDRLRALGITVVSVNKLSPETSRNSFFAADVGITGVDFLIAETGTIVLRSRPGEPRSNSLLPPMHIAVAQRSELIADLFDLFSQFAPGAEATALPSPLPSCLSLITGPSKTGDIELRLVTGVHGPGEIHVVLINA